MNAHQKQVPLLLVPLLHEVTGSICLWGAGRYGVNREGDSTILLTPSLTGAMPDGRKTGLPLSEGISPVQGADRHGPTAVIKSSAKMDHVKTGGTLLNIKFTPALVAGDDGIDKWAHLVRGYFKMDGHHVQFNVVRVSCSFQREIFVCDQKETNQKTRQWSKTMGLALGSGAWRR